MTAAKTGGASAAQVRAAAPGASSWVSANAGSGKTRVLTDRVARLLLAGTDPRKILCLTYTTAAAAEMQNRLFHTLGKWAMLDDAPLRVELSVLGEPAGDLTAAELDSARTLFARALETPGGLKIQTIHAFCDALLRRFPLEAGVAPRFAMLEDRSARALREAVLDALAEDAPEIMAGMATYLSGDDPDPLLTEIAQHRTAFAGPLDADGLAAALGAPAGVTLADLNAAVMTPEARACLARLGPILAVSGPADRALGVRLAEAAAAAPEAGLALLEGALLFGSTAKEPFGAKLGKIPTKGVRAAHPGEAAILDALMERVAAARGARLALAALARSMALNSFARAFLNRYEARKRALGMLDFDDLIDRARLLLERPETAAWVLWRLDGGLDHILVDEAQDTSPAQWRVIEAISAEFFAGVGARDLPRTIFVVGDEKQSIYSFQGADPVAFGRMRTNYERMLGDMGRELRRCDLLYSFRSAPPVLRLVDAVFAGPGGAGLDAVAHHAFHAEMPGRVEVWPFRPKPERAEESPWDKPLDAPEPGDPVTELAEAVAARARGWLDAGTELPGTGKAITAGDILVLVQRRGPLFHAVIRALKAARVPVAGADVLRLGGELAVKDLLAVLRVAATAGDDLSLAAFLRGPLGGVSEAELFGLAAGRDGGLWAALRARAEEWPEAWAILSEARARADYLRPFELLERILVRHDGRRRLVARLGAEAEDGIDALLDLALAYERVEAPSLTGFLGWIDRDELTIKRRLDAAADQARVMTVHGAKGLEAPIVILPDTAARREGGRAPQLLRLPEVAAWRTRAEHAPPALAEAEAARRAGAGAENRRLLYVALTRARSWLIVAGAGQAPKPEDESWYGMVEAAARSLGAVESEAGLVLEERWTEGETGPAAAPKRAGEALPDWATRPAPATRESRNPLISPSDLGGAHALPFEPDASGEGARERGEAVHLLLERLRGFGVGEWPAVAARLLPGRADVAELVAEAGAVLRAAEGWGILGPEALVEVEIAAPLGEPGRLVGRIDRLLVEEDRILAIDFKSNRGVPASAALVPEGILRQMGAYAAALAAIWPGRKVETAIVWTRTAMLMPLPAEATAAALARALAER